MSNSTVAMLRFSASGKHFTLHSPVRYLGALRWSLRDMILDEDAHSPAATSWALAEQGEDLTLVSDDFEIRISHRDAASVVRAVVSQLNNSMRSAVEAPLHVHCGCVSTDSGAIVIVGHSGVGKSTLTAALVASHASYVSDESVAINEDLLVSGFPKPLSVKQGSRDAVRALLAEQPAEDNWQVPASALGAIEPKPVEPYLLVFYRFDPTLATEVAITELHRADALVELLESTLDFSGRSVKGFSCAARLVAHARCIQLIARDITQASSHLLALKPAEHDGVIIEIPQGAPSSEYPTRAKTSRSVSIDGRVVVINEVPDALGIHDVLALDGPASVWWQLLDGTSPVDNVADLHTVLGFDEADLHDGLQAFIEQLSDFNLIDTGLRGGDSAPSAAGA